MRKSEEGGAIYPEGVVSPREKLEYLKAVYGIDKPNLFDLVIKELIIDAVNEVDEYSTNALNSILTRVGRPAPFKHSYSFGELYYEQTFKSEEA
jgi:hypothetical protein